MTSGLEDAVVAVLDDWLSDPSQENAQKGLITLHNYPRITSGTDIRKVILEGWDARMHHSCEILSEHGYECASNWAGNLSALGTITGACMEGVIGAAIGCLFGLFIPYAIADVHRYNIRVKTRWIYEALEMTDPKEWHKAIAYALQVHNAKLKLINENGLAPNNDPK